MKLSEIKGDRVFDVIADIIEPICNIGEDKEAMKLFERKKLPKGKNPRDFAIERIKKSLPALLKTHKQDLIKILAAIEGVSEAEYAETLNLMKLTSDAVDLLNDEEFMAFFTSTAATYGDTSVNTPA